MTGADRRKLNKDAGFSLLELLIAVVILAIIVIPLLNLFLSSNKINIKSRQTLRATTAAQDIMEGLKAYNIEEVKAQFADPASGFYVIDSRLIKGGVKEEYSLEAEGLYVFSMEELNMQGSKFDAKIEVDGREYRTDTSSPPPAATHDQKFNDAALADARSIDKKNGTFVEEERIRQAVLTSVIKDSSMRAVFGDSANEADIKNRLKKIGLSETVPDGEPFSALEEAYQDLQLSQKPDGVSFKGSPNFFDHVSREITIYLSESSEEDENGRKKVDMAVTEKYTFDLKGGHVVTTGDVDSGILIGDPDGDPARALSCGSIPTMVETDPVTGADVEKVNVNLFYYPLYGASVPDKIIINNSSRAHLNLLIAKLRHEKEKEDPTDPGKTVPDTDDPEYLTDSQLMAAEQSYRADIVINNTYGFDPDKFSLKTNLGRNLAGEKYVAGAPGTSIDLPEQFNGGCVAGIALSQLNIFTLDGVRSPLGKPAQPGEATELIYDVEVSVYEEGAAASGFPDDMRMVVIGGSMTN